MMMVENSRLSPTLAPERNPKKPYQAKVRTMCRGLQSLNPQSRETMNLPPSFRDLTYEESKNASARVLSRQSLSDDRAPSSAMLAAATGTGWRLSARAWAQSASARPLPFCLMFRDDGRLVLCGHTSHRVVCVVHW